MVNRAFGPVWLAALGLIAAASAAQAQMQSFVLPNEVTGGAQPMGAPLSAPPPAEPVAPRTRTSQAPAASAAPPTGGETPSKPKPKPVPTVVVTNASTSIATEVVITSGDMTAKVDKPLGPKEKISLRLPKLKGCTVSLAATFEGEGQVDAGEFNVCKDKSIRFTD